MNPLLDPAARLVIAHRGNAAHAPENTLEAFEEAVALGADALELDVHVTSDVHVVAIHDPTLDRTTDGSGVVGRLALADVRRFDAGARFTRDGGRTHPWRGRGLRVPTLDEVLDAFPTVPLLVELKTPAAAAATKRTVERHGASARCLMGSFLHPALAPFRGSAIASGASQGEVARLYARAVLPGSPRRIPYHALCIPPVYRNILPLPVLRFARMARAADACTHVWTVDDPARALRYWAGGVNGIITNDPARMLAAAGRVIERALRSAV